MPDVEIVAGCDLIPGKAAKFFKDGGVEGVKTDYASHKEMLDDESLQLDAVSICTYNRQHAEPAIYALNKGVHVMLEKPFTVTLEPSSSTPSGIFIKPSPTEALGVGLLAGV